MKSKYGDKWDLILGDKRFRKIKISPIDARNPFENDYGRLISSAPIRRLQDKTQVWPLSPSDYIRTRLTHSLEVSYIAGSLGKSIEKSLLENGEISSDKQGYLCSLLQVSGLIHDLGNPPFGHFGEKSIQAFFTKYFKEHSVISEKLSPEERADFEHFDGNVQTFRMLTKLYYFGDEWGFNLTFSSLASVIKYPVDSIHGNKTDLGINYKKFGYFCTEKDRYEDINSYLQLGGKRSPITYILEAADDIAYSAADAEDGIKMGIITLKDVEECFKDVQDLDGNNVLDQLREYEEQNPNNDFLTIQKFRIYTQQHMIRAVLEEFEEHYDDIMLGTYDSEILNKSGAKYIRAAFKKLFYKISEDREILKKEIAGGEAIKGLLDIFVSAATKNIEENSDVDEFLEGKNTLEGRLYKLLSPTYRTVFETIDNSYSNPLYCKLHLIVDYISGMTDKYVIQLFQELKGIKL